MKFNEIIKTEQDLKCLGYHITNNMIKSINAKPKLKDNKDFMENYNKYRSAIAVSHPFIQ